MARNKKKTLINPDPINVTQSQKLIIQKLILFVVFNPEHLYSISQLNTRNEKVTLLMTIHMIYIHLCTNE